MAEQDEILENEDDELEDDEISNSEAAVVRGYHADIEKTRTKGTKTEEEEIDEDFGAEFWGDEEIVDD